MAHKNKKGTYTIPVLFFAICFLFFLHTSYALAQVKLQIPVDKLAEVSQAEMNQGKGIIVYLVAIYTWLVGVISLLAVIFLMVGGLIWLTARGSQKQLGFAKKLIKDSFVGLGIAIGSYFILFMINPNLVNFAGFGVEKIEGIDFQLPEANPTDIQDGGDSNEKAKIPTNLSSNSIYCPKSGGAKEFEKIIKSFKGKVAYRFGGKGGSPPYKETNPDYMKYNTYCPPGNECFDCSGFVNIVFLCAGLQSPGGGTDDIFSGTEKIISWDVAKQTINDKELKPGDLIGYLKSETTHPAGHVLLYAGGGLFIQTTSSGGHPGRQPGANPKQSSMSHVPMKDYKHIKRL